MLKIGKILQKFGGGNTPVSNTTNNAPQYEICVSCGKTTNVLVEMPIDARKHYIVGCGQLCEKCADALKYKRPTPPREVTNEMLIASLRENDKEN